MSSKTVVDLGCFFWDRLFEYPGWMSGIGNGDGLTAPLVVEKTRSGLFHFAEVEHRKTCEIEQKQEIIT